MCSVQQPIAKESTLLVGGGRRRGRGNLRMWLPTSPEPRHTVVPGMLLAPLWGTDNFIRPMTRNQRQFPTSEAWHWRLSRTSDKCSYWLSVPTRLDLSSFSPPSHKEVLRGHLSSDPCPFLIYHWASVYLAVSSSVLL